MFKIIIYSHSKFRSDFYLLYYIRLIDDCNILCKIKHCFKTAIIRQPIDKCLYYKILSSYCIL